MTGSAKCVLNLRKTPEKPEKADNIIEVLQKNQTMQIKEDNGEWLKVAIGRKTGYVMAKYVAIHPEAAEPGEPGTPGQGDPGATGIPEQLEIEKDKAAGEIDEDGNFLIDGKIVGKVDGDNILITDPDIIAETLAEIEKEDGKDE